MIKAIIVGVSQYQISNHNLPKCRNDIYAMQKAIIVGLNATPDNITLCGENQSVYVSDFYNAFAHVISQIDISDTFIFFFSGHGYKKDSKNYLVFSDGFVGMEKLIDLIDNVNCKNKIVMIDSCHSGNKDINFETTIDINQTADTFVGHGCAVMAACDLDELSGFDPNGDLSLYTRILCDALTTRILIKKGKKSLDDIRNYVDRLVNIANKSANPKQHNAFRANIIGTIFFDVEDYIPYKSPKIYKETDKYIIYSVSPTHANVKRISLEVILRFPYSEEELADIANEIKNDALYYDVYENQKSELRFRGLPNNIIFTYYGYDENDMINHNYAYRSVWVDENQNKDYWYKLDKQSVVIDNIWINTINSYNFNKKYIAENIADNDKLVNQTRNCMYKMIICAEKFIAEYREYVNRTITEQELIKNVSIIVPDIEKLFFEQSNFSIASNELHNWQSAYTNLASAIHDFSLCYNSYSLKNRDSKNRMQLVELTIKKYDESLEKIKLIDNDLVNMLNKSEDFYE